MEYSCTQPEELVHTLVCQCRGIVLSEPGHTSPGPPGRTPPWAPGCTPPGAHPHTPAGELVLEPVCTPLLPPATHGQLGNVTGIILKKFNFPLPVPPLF